MDERKERRSDLLALAIVLLVPTLLFSDVLFGNRSLYHRDLTVYHDPINRIVRETIRGGELPLWNRLYAAGQPMAANPAYEIFYPPQWLILLPDYRVGFALQIILHFWIAAAGMLLLLRSLGTSRMAAVFASVSFTCSGFLASLTNLLPFLFSIVWLPWIVLFTVRFLRSFRRRDFALASLALSMQVLRGEPVTLAQTILLIFLIGVAIGMHEGDGLRGIGRAAGRCTAIVAAALLSGAAQLLPMVDHARDSVRSLGFSFEAATSWSMPLVRPLELVFARWMGTLSEEGIHYWGSQLYSGHSGPFLLSMYMGLLVVILTAAGLLTRQRGSLLFAVLFAISCLVALGQHTPLYGALFQFRFFQSSRYPEKYIFVGLFVLVVYAAVVLDRLVDGDRALVVAVRRAAIGFVVLAAAAHLTTFTAVGDPFFKWLWNIPSSARITALFSIWKMEWLKAVLRAVAALCVFMVLQARGKRAFAVALTLFLGIDLIPIAWESAPRIDARFFDRPAAASLLPQNADYRIFHQASLDRVSDTSMHFLEGTAGYWAIRNGLFPMRANRFGFPTVFDADIDETQLLPTRELSSVLTHLLTRRDVRSVESLLALSNVRYRLRFADYRGEMTRVRGNSEAVIPVRAVFLDGNPRYFFAESVAQARSALEMERLLAGRAWPRRMAFLAEQSFTPATGSVNRVRETSRTATVDVTASGPALLVAAVTYHKYWRATIDGEPARLLRANIAYQAVRVPAGRHVVEFRYFNPIVAAGVVTSIVAMSALVALIFKRPETPAAEVEA